MSRQLLRRVLLGLAIAALVVTVVLGMWLIVTAMAGMSRLA